MNRCAFCAWIPIFPLPVGPLAGQCRLGQNTVVGSMPCSSWLCVEAYQEGYVGSPFSLQVSFATVKGSATPGRWRGEKRAFIIPIRYNSYPLICMASAGEDQTQAIEIPEETRMPKGGFEPPRLVRHHP